MKLSDVPVSVVLGSSPIESEVAELLGRAAQNKPFTHSAPIEGMPVSGRIFSTEAFANMVPLPNPSVGDDIARQLILLTEQNGARYDPPSRAGSRGWQIARAAIGGNPAAIAWAVWCVQDDRNYA